MNLENLLNPLVKETLSKNYGVEITDAQLQFQKTRKDFEGDITLVVFPLVKMVKKSPEQTANEIGALLVAEIEIIEGYNAVQGFLNLILKNDYWLGILNQITKNQSFGIVTEKTSQVMVEFSSPNTNKPLHLGHLRNNFLGHSVARILDAAGKNVIKTQIINDRGIHICKSMLAWQKFGNGETPASSGMKGDKLVGKYYVEFDKVLKSQTQQVLIAWQKGEFEVDDKTKQEYQKLATLLAEKEDEKAKKGIEEKIQKLANNSTSILQEAKAMLVAWEAKDLETVSLWRTMNGWVYDGFATTYASLELDFDHLYYESDTYLTGKDLVDEGIRKGVFYKKEDGSVWIDLTAEGMDEKLVLRSDGTAVYITQDIGTAQQRMQDYPGLNGIVYTVGNEQDHHFKVLFIILEKLGYSWAKNCFHLSYGMVDLPSGKMKSREGTVVDADDLMAEVVEKAKDMTEERGHIDGMTDEEKTELYHTIGLGGLKYYLLKVDPSKRMLFQPEESVELNGNTGPFIQYVHARISSLLRKSGDFEPKNVELTCDMEPIEREIIKKLSEYADTVQEAAKEYSPALIANYAFELGKLYNNFWQSVSIFKEENLITKEMRLQLSANVAKVIKSSMFLLGIKVPERM
jgi:arginyl-tRNA synthetase